MSLSQRKKQKEEREQKKGSGLSTIRDLSLTENEKELLLSSTVRSENMLPTFTIESAAIHLMSFEELRDMSVCEVYEESLNGQPHSLTDPAMGVSDNNVLCGTCNKDGISCPGHLGRIVFALPIYHPYFIREIVQVLTCVCNCCGRLFLTKEEMISKGFLSQNGYLRLNPKAHLDQLAKYCKKTKKCRNKVKTKCSGNCTGGTNVLDCSPNPEFSSQESKDLYDIIVKRKVKGAKRRDDARGDDKYSMPIKSVIDILDCISDEDAALMGFTNGSHPRNMIMHGLAVIPPASRPSSKVGGRQDEHNLTLAYLDIIKNNQALKRLKEISEASEKEGKKYKSSSVEDPYDSDHYRNFRENVLYFIDNTQEIKKFGSKRILQGISQLIQGKEALIRSHIMAKRVNYSGRTVLSPDPTLKFGQIGVPESMRHLLTSVEIVASFNMNRIRDLIRRKEVTYYIEGSGAYQGRRREVNNLNRDQILRNLKIGDKVERMLANGDYIIFNRQPTIHKASMMGHQVVIRKNQLTIGVFPSAAKPYNADFDGDEGNLHAPQSDDVKVEIMSLMNICSNLMSSQTNKPLVNPILDAITGAYILTTQNKETGGYEGKGGYVCIEPDIYMNALGMLICTDSLPTLTERLVDALVLPKIPSNIEDLSDEERKQLRDQAREQISISKKENRKNISEKEIDQYVNSYIKGFKYSKYPGNALFSSLLPPDFFYTKGDVRIRNGILIEGTIGSKDIGGSHNGIIQIMYKTYGPSRVVEFLTDAPHVLEYYITQTGFSIGLKDCILPTKEDRKRIDTEIQKIELIVESMSGKLKDPIEEAAREKEIRGIVNVAKNIGQNIAMEKLAEDNPLVVMAKSGAKGTAVNTAQITGALSQQFAFGKRMDESMSGGTRCLPYFAENDPSIQARGFCINSFSKGLTPAELFFHQAGGREGIVDSALNTQDAGDIHRRMVKVLEDIKVAHDGSVRNAIGVVFSFTYADDGFAPEELQLIDTPSGSVACFFDPKALADRLNAKYA